MAKNFQSKRPRRSTSTTIRHLVDALDRIAPFSLAEDWDNVGLLAGDPDAPCTRVLVCVDATSKVVAEAAKLKVQAIVSYHPALFTKERTIGASTVGFEAVRAGIALISPHTALDAAQGGVNDLLAWAVGDGGRTPIRPSHSVSPSEALRIVTHVPSDAVDRVRDAMSRAGAGRIGHYSHCAFVSEGIGSFLGGPTSNPAIGKAGVLETVSEMRLEMPCSQSSLPSALAAIRRAHPYEQPAIHVTHAAARPSAFEGQGRMVALTKAATTDAIANWLAKSLASDAMQVATNDPKRKHSIIGVCAGSGESLLHQARARGASCFVTGEMKHHDVLAALASGIDLILCGHTESERPSMMVLAARIRAEIPSIKVGLSAVDLPPLRRPRSR